VAAGISQSQSMPACTRNAAEAAAQPAASARPPGERNTRTSAAPALPRKPNSRSRPIKPSSVAVSRYSECASCTDSEILRRSSHSSWKPCVPTPVSGFCQNPWTATRQ
jgi:hypothetical protein